MAKALSAGGTVLRGVGQALGVVEKSEITVEMMERAARASQVTDNKDDDESGDEEVDDIDLLQLSMEASAPPAPAGPSGPIANESNANVSADPDAVSETPTVKDANTRSVFDEQKLAEIDADRQNVRLKRDILTDLAVPQFKKEKKLLAQKQQRQTPYLSIDVVFNHRHLYANLQDHDPELIYYDFAGHSKRWCEFKRKAYDECLNLKVLTPFYPDKGLVSLQASHKDALDHESVINSRVKDTLTTHRSYQLHMETEFAGKFEFQKDSEDETNSNATAVMYVQTRLEYELTLAYHRPELSHLDDYLIKLQQAFEKEQGINDMATALQNSPVPTEEANVRWIEDWRSRIVDSLSKEQCYMETVLHFKHSDPNRIADATIQKCKAMFEIEEKREPKFIICCMVYRLSASICPVRLYVGVTCKRAD